MPRVSDWPPPKPPPLSYLEAVAATDRRRAEAARARERRLRDLVLGGVWLVGAVTLILVLGFVLF